MLRTANWITIFGTPDELSSLKKNCNAILRQLGHFQIFLTITSSEVYDRDAFVQMVGLEEDFALEHEGETFKDAGEMYDQMDAKGEASSKSIENHVCRVGT